MHFGNPIALWSLLLLPLLLLAGWLALRRRERIARRIGDSGLIHRLVSDSVPRWRRRRVWAGILIYSLLAISAARPQYGRVEQTIRRAGVDVLIAVDTSASMLATDVEPNRLTVAKESLKRLTRRLEGNRVGIIAFAGDSFLLSPLTLDYEIAGLVLESVDHESVGTPGTDLGRAIQVAQSAFEKGGQGSPVLVLITDGEDNEGKGLAAAKEAAEKIDLRVYAIGIGTDRGAPVPDEGGGYKETAANTKVVSRLDMKSLEAIADATGGEAYEVGAKPGPAVNSITLKIDRIEKGELQSRKMILYQDRYGWFVAPAALLLLWLLISRPRRQAVSAPAVIEDTPAPHAKGAA
jgi:Ca-activated chloride channel family protein